MQHVRFRALIGFLILQLLYVPGAIASGLPITIIPFGSRPAQLPITFGPGQIAKVSGKYFNSTSSSAPAILCNGCAGVDIQNSDFDVPNFKAIWIKNTTVPIPVLILHNRFRTPMAPIVLEGVKAAPASKIMHNAMRGITPKFQQFIALSKNTSGQDAANPLKVWYNHGDGRDQTTRNYPTFPAGSTGILVGDGATDPNTGFIELIYNDLLWAGQTQINVRGGTNIILYYNHHLQTPSAGNAMEAVRISKDPASVTPAVAPTNTVSYFWIDDEVGSVPQVVDDGTMGVVKELSNVQLGAYLDTVQ